MKAIFYDSAGNKKEEIELPKIFNTPIREDLAAKYFETEKFLQMQPYAPYAEAGKRHSASGTISHKRHEWKGHYGKGISRAPRKTMSRRGTQFYWIGAEVAQARGGRAAHPPIGIHRIRKINKKEQELALASGFAATASTKYLLKRYTSLENIDSAPIVISSLPDKIKDFINILKNIFGQKLSLIIPKKEVRSGKGKRRGRKYKSNAGLLIVTGNKEKLSFQSFDVKSVQEISISDIYPLGRLTLYTQKALEELK